MNFAVIGFGLIGKERVNALSTLKQSGDSIESIMVFDSSENKKDEIKSFNGVKLARSLEEIDDFSPDWVIVSTPHDVALEYVEHFIPMGCKILMEKPFGRSYEEALCVYQKLQQPDQLYVGFDYRFYHGVAQAISDARNGVFGRLVNVTMELGHGGAPGMENSWKLDLLRAGGGCLIDPGIHLLDLCLIISNGDLKPVCGSQWSGFWNTGIEEEVLLLLEAKDFVINLNISIVRWRSTFRMEVNGTDGYGIVTGRNRSYGFQTYLRGKRWGWKTAKTQAESEEVVLSSDGTNTFRDELSALLFPEKVNPSLLPCSATEALTTMKLFMDCLKVIGIQKRSRI
jgi:predicted dehydrogenase